MAALAHKLAGLISALHGTLRLVIYAPRPAAQNGRHAEGLCFEFNGLPEHDAGTAAAATRPGQIRQDWKEPLYRGEAAASQSRWAPPRRPVGRGETSARRHRMDLRPPHRGAP
jgi:hypothetical protein